MKAIGVVRKIDLAGRIVLPILFRKNLGINVGDSIEIYVNGDEIILNKYETKRECIVTGNISDKNLVFADGKITVSRENMDLLMKELENYLERK